MGRLQEYLKIKEELDKELVLVKKRQTSIGLLRLLVFVITGFLIYYFFHESYTLTIVSLVGIVSFLRLLQVHLKLTEKKRIITAKISINTIEIEVLNGDVSSLKTGEEYRDPQHAFSHDIDLFGQKSFFQYVNRTVTKEGSDKLALILTKNATDSIKLKQQVIADLSKKLLWRQHFSALASLVKVDISARTIIQFMSHYDSVFSKNIKRLPTVFSILSLLLMIAVSFQWLSANILVLWFFVGFGVTARFFKKTQKIYIKASKSKEIFKQYYQLLEQIEQESFSGELLNQMQQEIQSEEEKASKIFMKFSKILDAFDQRNNLLIILIGNAFFLWDLRCASKAELWIETYQHTVEKWFEVIACFDAQSSLANFAYNHLDYNFPKIVDGDIIIQSKSLGHPLIRPDKRVANDFTINDKGFYIVTGANMAGKSTFLRTVSLSIVMANSGLPVCATSYKYNPIQLMTSMRTADSLADDESYFYAELKRLKYIVDKIESKDYFIVLDEILKGTNSKDKAIGSKKFVEKLVNSQSTGIIATHDVSLCELEGRFPQIENYFFDAQIKDDELYFDYAFKKGVCQNMNASFLLRKMKIV